LKIAIATPLYARDENCDSGIAIHYKHLTSGLLELGHEVVIYFFPYEVFLSSTYESNGVTIHQLGCSIPKLFYQRGIGRFFKFFKTLEWYPTLSMQRQVSIFLKNRVKEDRVDIIESTSNRGMLANYTKYRNRPPICTRVSTTMTSAYQKARNRVPLNYRLEAKLENLQIRRSDYLVTHSNGHARTLETELGIKRTNFKIIPIGIPITKKRSEYHSDKSKINIEVLFVGRLENRKGIDILITAIPKIIQKNSSISFNIIGSDPMNLKESYKSNQLFKNHVQFLGKVSSSELENRYKKCDIFVAPSRYESFGIVFVEAMKFSKPVIGTNVGGIPDIVLNNKNGYLIEPESVEALVNAVIKLAGSFELRKEMGRKGRKRVMENFSTQAMTIQSVEYYKAALSNIKS
jgi:glycosyltransferase involved in cell wall biosynthesis